MSAYHRTTVYLTDEQRVWLRRLAAHAQLAGVPMSASDVIRLAIDRARVDLTEDEVRALVVQHVHEEVVLYPGRAKRGMPDPPVAATA